MAGRNWRRITLSGFAALSLLSSVAASLAQVPAPVPALPDTERRTAYSISASLCSCSVGFALFGDSTDVGNWLEVSINGVLIPASGNWTITSPSGSLATLPRPITDAVLTFTNVQTGTVQIVGARRPRRTSQFSENRGVAARDLNQAITDLVAMLRENWDKTNDVTGRAGLARPGETLALLPVLASRANMGACFDSGGNLVPCVAAPSGSFIAGKGILFTGSSPTTISAPGPTSNPQTADYSIQTTDCGSTVVMTSNPHTVTLPGVGGFPTACVVQVCNGDANDITHHAAKLSGFPAPSFTRLWMQQCETVSIANATWQATTLPPLFRPNFTVTFFLDNAGNDNNDGLVSNAAGNALATLQGCFNIIASEMLVATAAQTASTNYPVCSPTAGQTFVGSSTLQGPAPGADIILVTGNGGVATLRPTATTGQWVIQQSDFAPAIQLTNMKLDCTGGAHPCNSVFINQYAIFDFLAGVTLSGSGSTDNGVFCNFACKVNGNALVTISGTFGSPFTLHYGSTLIMNSGLTIANGTTISNNLFRFEKNSTLFFSSALTIGTTVNVSPALFDGNTGAQLLFSGNFTTSGSLASGRQWTVLNNSLLCNDSGTTIPGTAGTNSTAGAGAGIIAAATGGSNCAPAYP